MVGADCDVRVARLAGVAGANLSTVLPAVAVALVLMPVARPIAVFLCLAPFRFNWRERTFIAWVGLRGAVAIFLASIPMLVGLPNAQLYFDVAFVVVLISLLLQGWTLASAARWLHVALPRADRGPRRVELDLPGQLEQQLVGYPVRANSLFLKRGLIPSWSKPTLVIATRRFCRRPKPSRWLRATIFICLRRPKRPKRSIVSLSTCLWFRLLILTCWVISR
jgi:cell volume regulation protein A